MIKFLSGAAAAALVVAFAPAIAQPAPPAPPGVAQGTAPLHAAPSRDVRVRVMSDRTMTRDEVVTHVRDLFARLDADRDGYVTRGEVEAMHRKFAGSIGKAGEIRQRLREHGVLFGDRGAMFDRLDANHDGSISRQEFMASQPRIGEPRVLVMRGGAGAPEMPGMDHMRMMHMHGAGMGFGGHLFDMADANHDGRVSLAEAEAAALAHFDRADLNHDGKITPQERAQAHARMREHRPS